MLDVFIDMVNTSRGSFGNQRGGRCAVGSALWEIGIPHDRLLGVLGLCLLSCEDKSLCDKYLKGLRGGREGDIEVAYDNMIHDLDLSKKASSPVEREMYMCDARWHARNLVNTGKGLHINFIIASPLPKVAKREAACV